MDTAELLEVMSADGLRLLDSLPPYDGSVDVMRTVEQLRAAGHPPARVAAVLTQARLRSRAVRKFGPFAQRMLFTEDGLEQATRLSVAALHASRFRRAGLTDVADLGCGIGADALALAALEIEVTAVERDEATAAIAAYNLAPWPNVRVEHGDAESIGLDGRGAAFLDPARRQDGRRLSDPDDWSPSLSFGYGLAERMPVGMKLGPGVDRDLIPADCEAQWVSIGREVVEVGLWFGPLARPGVSRAALVIGDEGTDELVGAADSEDVAVGPLGDYVLEPDGSVIRSRLIGDLARSIDARMVSGGIAYLTTDGPVESPFASCFRVIARLPWDRRALRKELAARRIGSLEIKKRGVDVDPALLRRSLSLSGDVAATLIVTRVEGRHSALLCERVSSSPASGGSTSAPARKPGQNASPKS